MRLLDVRGDLEFQVGRKVKIDHGCVGLVHLVSQFFSLSAKILHITGHVTDDNGIENGA